MTTIFSDTFDSGLSAWQSVNGNGGTAPTVSSTTKYGGSQSAQLQIADQAWSYSELRKSFGTGYNTAYYRGYIRFSALPSTGETLSISPDLRGNTLASDSLADLLIYNDSGTCKFGLEYYTDSGYVNVYTTSLTPTVNTWYYAEVMVTVNASAGVVRLWIAPAGSVVSQGSPTIQVTGLANDNTGNAQHVVATAYSPQGVACTCYIDEIMVSDAFIGPIPASKLAYTAGAGQSITVGTVSGVVTVQVQDASGNPVTSGATVNLDSTSSGKHFYSDSDGNNSITNFVISSGQSLGSFYYKDTVAGTPTLTASATGLTSATTQFTINSGGSGDLTVTGNLTVNGNATIGSSSSYNWGNGGKIDTYTGQIRLYTNTSGIGLWLNAPTGVATAHNILDDGTGGMTLAGSLIIGGIASASNYITTNGYVTASGGTSNGPGYRFSTYGPAGYFGGQTGVGLNNAGQIVLNAGSGGVVTANAGAQKNTLDDGSGNMTIAGGMKTPIGASIERNADHVTISNRILPTEGQPYKTYTDLGHGNILFKHTRTADQDHKYPPIDAYGEHWGRYANIYLIMLADPGDSTVYQPMIAMDRGLWVEKDIQTYGAYFTQSDPGKGAGGGAILIGHGLTKNPNAPNDDPPRIILVDSERPPNLPITEGYFNTLYITKSTTPVYATRTNIQNWDLGNLSVGSIRHTFTVGSGGVTIGQIVALDSYGNVVPALFFNNETKVIGVVTATKNSGEKVEVIVWGLARVAVDTEINPGDRICASNINAGKAISFNWHYHQMSIQSTPFSGNTETVNSGIVIGKALTHGTPQDPGYVDMIVSISG